MTTAAETHTLTITRILRASPERVFEAISTPDGILSWFKPKEGVYATAVEMELREGGRWCVTMTNPEKEVFSVMGEVREVVPPHRLSYTWGWKNTQHEAMPETLVKIEVKDHPDGAELTLVHEGFATEHMREMHVHGWTGCLNVLESHYHG